MTDPFHGAYAESSPHAAERPARQDAALAESFVVDPALEDALRVRDTDPATFATFPASLKLATGYYSLARAAAGGQR